MITKEHFLKLEKELERKLYNTETAHESSSVRAMVNAFYSMETIAKTLVAIGQVLIEISKE